MLLLSIRESRVSNEIEFHGKLLGLCPSGSLEPTAFGESRDKDGIE